MIQPKKVARLKPRNPFNKLVERALQRTARKVHKEAAARGIRLVIAKNGPASKTP